MAPSLDVGILAGVGIETTDGWPTNRPDTMRINASYGLLRIGWIVALAFG